MNYGTNLGLLLLHALPLDNEMWSAQMQLLPTRTHAPNLYGFGKDIGVWAKKSLAGIQERRLIVVGCSVGGSCALEIGKMAPERIAALVLIGTKARHDPNPDFHQKSLELLKDKGVEAAWQLYWEPLFESGRDNMAAQAAKTIALRQSAKNLMNGLSAFHTRPSREEFVAQCDFPIHVITGDEDELPGLNYSRHLAETAKNGQLHVVRSSGHYVPMEKPQKLNALLESIIQTHSSE